MYNTKIIKFGWELFILWIITYGLSFSGFAIEMSLKENETLIFSVIVLIKS